MVNWEFVLEEADQRRMWVSPQMSVVVVKPDRIKSETIKQLFRSKQDEEC